MQIHLSTSESRWRVLVDQQPICADTTEDIAKRLFVATARKFPKAETKFWEGNIGQESDLSVESFR